jgi:glycosyltransferase involved in cell wall biosynthesis
MRSLLDLLPRLIVLKDSFDRRRLRIAYDLLRRGHLRTLMLQLVMHTAFRLQLRRLGIADIDPNLAPPADEPDGPQEFYHETSWPRDAPLVTVVIPCFNYGAFVAEAVDSVLAQTFRDLEIIVVEGGSTDGTTRPIVAALRDPKVRILFRDSPCRTGDNRNFGIEQARGKYICCLDADDILRPTYIEKSVFVLENYGYDVVSTAVRQFGASDGGYGVLPRPDLSDMLRGNQVATSAVFRRALWQQAGGFKDTAPGTPYVYEDWRFWVRLAALGARILNITGEQLFCYRVHAGPSLSRQDGILSPQQQAPLVRQLNQDVIKPEAFVRSRARAALRLRSFGDGRNLVRGDARPSILLAISHLVLGGAERLMSEVVRGLCEAGYRVVIVTTVPTWPQLGDTTSWFEPYTEEIYHLPRFLPHSCWPEFVDYVIEAKSVRTILLVGSTFFYESLADLKQRYGWLRVVDLLFNTVAHANSNRTVADLIDATIVEGADVESWLLANGESPHRIHRIPSGVDLLRFKPASRPPHVMRELGFSPDAFVAGFSGRLATEKAPVSFIKIAAQVQAELPIRFVMTGTGPLEGEVRNALKREGGMDRVAFAGAVGDICDYLACYDVLVLPSLFDGRPTIVMEALAMGIPVIASKVGSLPELVVDGETGFLCEPGDFRNFASHIQWLFEHPTEHARMREAARRFAETHFQLRQMVSEYIRIVGRLTDVCDAEARSHSKLEAATFDCDTSDVVRHGNA